MEAFENIDVYRAFTNEIAKEIEGEVGNYNQAYIWNSKSYYLLQGMVDQNRHLRF